jgi:hypothetical protein
MNNLTENLIDAILNGDKEAAHQAFTSSLADKVTDALELKKVEIASNLLGAVEDNNAVEVETEVDAAAELEPANEVESTDEI